MTITNANGDVQLAPINNQPNTHVANDTDEDRSPSDSHNAHPVKPYTKEPNSPPLPTKDAPATPSKKDSSGEGKPNTQAYREYITQFNATYTDLPKVDIIYKDLSYTVSVPKRNFQIPNVGKSLVSIPVNIYNKVTGKAKAQTDDIPALQNLSGILRAGTSTLILAQAGAGKSSFLRALSNRLYLSKTQRLTGEVIHFDQTHGNIVTDETAIRRLTAYCPQIDHQYDSLTVRETLMFAAQNALAPISSLQASEEFKAAHAEKVDALIAALGLEECANTMVGGALKRGISGGQLRRLTLAESIITNSRVLALDEFTNGLDVLTAYDISKLIVEWCHQTGGCMIAALQQSSPEIVQLFDRIVVMKDGFIVYDGTYDKLEPFFTSLGAVKPPHMDVADFVVEYLTNSYRYTSEERIAQLQQEQRTIDVQYMLEAWHQTEMHQQNQADIQLSLAEKQQIHRSTSDQVQRQTSALSSILPGKVSRQTSNTSTHGDHPAISAYTRQQYYSSSTHNFVFHLTSLLHRQALITKRNTAVFVPRLAQATGVGFVLATLWFQLAVTNYQSKLGLMQSLLTQQAFMNTGELALIDVAKPVVTRQVDSRWYRALEYQLSLLIVQLPVYIIETLISLSLIYWVSGWDPDAGKFFFALGIAIINDVMFSCFFRMLGFLTPNGAAAQQLGAPMVGISLLFGGFLVTRNKLKIWMIEFYYVSPFSWTVRSLAQNEFLKASRYSAPTIYNGNQVTLGESYLLSYDFFIDDIWRFAGLIVIIGYTIIFLLLSVRLLKNKRFELMFGTKRMPAAAHGEHLVKSTTVDLPEMRRAVSEAANLLPFEPTTLTWSHVYYTVQVKSEENKTVDKVLLNDVSGYCEPGTLTALMGASGAGKTTLMDVIANRKTVGKIQGEIQLNGTASVHPFLQGRTAYVEQTDSHLAWATVKECVEFSAKLRLPSTVSAERRQQFVAETLKLLELDPIAQRLTATISPSQKKLTSIAVELACSPSVLFLDEPTTGLDARAALLVARVIKKVAATGRTVLVTIHQPSAEVFFLCDRLLLLKSGGRTVFFGDIGKEGSQLTSYLEQVSGEKKVEGYNPAAWMLDVTAQQYTAKQPSSRTPTGSKRSKLTPTSQQRTLKQSGNEQHHNNAAEAAVESGELKPQKFASNDDEHPTQSSTGLAADTKSTPFAGLDGSAMVQDYAQVYTSHELYTNESMHLDNLLKNQSKTDIAEDPRKQLPNPITKYVAVQKRGLVSHWRNTPLNYQRLWIWTIQSIMYGLVYFHLDTSGLAGVNSRIGGVMVSASFCAVIAAASAIAQVAIEKPMYYRERSVNAYSAWAYAISITINEMPILFVGTLIFNLVYWCMSGMNDISSADLFPRYFLAGYLLVLCFNSVAHLLASALPNILLSSQVMGIAYNFLFLFSGVYIHHNAMPAGWEWVWYLNPVPRALNAMVTSQFTCGDGPGCPYIQLPGSTQSQSDTQYVIDALDTNTTATYYWLQILWLAITYILLRLMFCLSVRYINHNKR